MPEPESPQVRRDRRTAWGALALVGFAAPAVGQVVPLTAGAWWWALASAGGALLLPFLYWAPYRALGLVPLAALAWLAAVGHGLYWGECPAWACGAPLGLIVGALLRGRRGRWGVRELAAITACGVAGVVLAWMAIPSAVGELRAAVIAGAVVLVCWTWARLYRPLLELMCEPPLWVMYRVRARGPGFDRFPRTGPCIVIANHACWLDPIFLAKVLPRPLTPMMTSKFYDLPLIRRLMRAFGVIRVPDRALKKDAPEVLEAVAALDRGECVVVFPEGYLRRAEDKPLRRFGQGVWQILKARPDTPVFAAWIEGGWGSYTSHRNGPPVKGKRPDLRRRVGVGMLPALRIQPEVLAEHLRTRTHLMNLVSAARTHLGLEPLPPFDLPAKADEPD